MPATGKPRAGRLSSAHISRDAVSGEPDSILPSNTSYLRLPAGLAEIDREPFRAVTSG